MLFYNDLIMPQGEYTYSANIQFDIVDDKKLMRFIPNEMSIELLRQYFIDIISEKPNHHSRILYGSYGTGKSHFLTVLSLLLGKMHVEGVAFNTFIHRVSKLDADLANDMKCFIQNDDKKPLLIVPIVFDFEDFDRSVYFSLQKALEQIGVKITFKTYFDQALNYIDNWMIKKDSEDKLKNACDKENISLVVLKKRLKSYDPNIVDVFNNVFSEMTFGVPFVYETTNLPESIKQAYEAISDKYSGFVFIFDEFGRYIEDNIKKIRVKQIQDLAEYCDHGDGNNHIILVSHKEISMYTHDHDESIANEWKKVEGRFKATSINDKQDQCLSLISSVLEKNEDVWGAFKEKFESDLDNLYASVSEFKGFLINKDDNNPFESAFPIHPITLFALDRLSKKVAQNERTFFTYLSSKEENSLSDFLSSHDLDQFSFVGIDDIFDYFELSIKAVQSSKAYSVYKDYINALEKGAFDPFGSSLEVRILKTLAVINIIEDTNALNANVATFLNVIDANKEDIYLSIENLSRKKIIKYFGTYDHFKFYESSIFDIDELIKNSVDNISDDSVSAVLNDQFVDFVLYPHNYNDEYKINRVFVPVYATTNDLNKNNFTNNLSSNYDGTLIMLLSNDSSFNLQDYEFDRSIVFVNKEASNIVKAVKDYIAILNLESIKYQYMEKDPFFERELEYCKNEQIQVVYKLLKEWRAFQVEDYDVYVDGRKQDAKSFKALSSLASEICQNQFNRTLIVNNELINKNIISGTMRNVRNKVLEAMINKPDEPYYGLAVLSPEYLFVRSLLAKNGFYDNVNDINVLNNGDNPARDIHNLFRRYFDEARDSFVEIIDLYKELKTAPYGLRDGYLPVLFAFMFLAHKNNIIVLSHGAEQEISAELFTEFVSRPKDFSFSLANWSKKQLRFVDELQQVFKDDIKAEILSRNKLKAIYEGMFSHYRQISKFSRTTEVYVSDDVKKYRSIMETSYSDYTKFVFGIIANISGDGDLKTSIRIIKNIKDVLESSLEHLMNDLLLNVKMVMHWDSNKSLANLLRSEYESEWKQKRQKSFDFMTNSFLDCVSKLDKKSKDSDVLNSLATILTGFECEYWNDKHRDEFIAKLTQIKTKLDQYELSDELNDSEIQISLVTGSGSERVIKFDKKDLSSLGMTMKNKIGQTLDNFGMSVSYDDKVQIILSILEELIEGK